MTACLDAIDKLRSLGYSFTLKGERLIYTYQGKGNPSYDEITPLLEVLKAHKADILNDPYFLIKQSLQRINEGWKSGTFEWMRRSRPEEWKKMILLEEKINRATLSNDEDAIRRALIEYKAFFLRIEEDFKAFLGESMKSFSIG